MGKFNYHIDKIQTEDVYQFVDDWSKTYTYKNEHFYNEHIDKALDSKVSFLKLFQWKNEHGETIASGKLNSINEYWKHISLIRNLSKKFDWSSFESTFNPSQNASIFKILLLHICDRNRFPIFDMNVYRAYHFFQFGEIREIPKKDADKYAIYKDIYLPWFQALIEQSGHQPKKIDEALFSFGRFLKKIEPFPVSFRLNKK